MIDYSPKYNAYLVRFYATQDFDNPSSFSKEFFGIVLAQNEEEAISLVEPTTYREMPSYTCSDFTAKNFIIKTWYFLVVVKTTTLFMVMIQIHFNST